MVDASAIKFYKSSKDGQSLGHYPSTANQIISKTRNNLFANINRTQQVAGTDQYLCMFLKNTSDEKIKNVTFWESAGSSSGDTSVSWAFETQFTAGLNEYSLHPYETFNGTSDSLEVASSSEGEYDTVDFTLSCWFRTGVTPAQDLVMVGKGLSGSETTADNYNYILFMNTSGQVSGGFEEAAGTNHFALSASSYNDSFWHHAAVSYNSNAGTVRLYIDGVNVNTHNTTTDPNRNDHNVMVGYGRLAGSYWNGDLDEVHYWDTHLSTAEIEALHDEDEMAQADNLRYSNHFGSNNNSRLAQGIADINTPPVGLTWQGSGSQPTEPNIGTLGPDAVVPIWIRWKSEANAEDRPNDRVIFNFKFDTSTTGTGTPGGGSTGGTGGNPQPAQTNWKIAVTGDWGVTDETDDVVNLIDDIGHDLVIGVGDNSYDDGSAADFWDAMKPIDDNQGSSCRFESAFGNHEYEEDDPVSAYTNHMKLSRTYYGFDWNNVHVLILDTNLSSFDEAQKTFAEKDLTEANNRSNIDWIFVSFHHPMGGAPGNHDPNEFNQIEEYADMFRSKNVNMVFVGHNHNIQRTYPIKRSGSSFTKVINSDGPYTVGTPEKWFIHVVSGAGGHDNPGSLYSVSNAPSYNRYQSNSYNGILSIQASNNAQTLTCKFIDTGGSTKHTWVINHD